MLPVASRLTHRDEFAEVMRRGRRSGRARLVVHVGRFAGARRARAGFVVSKAVGGSVVRHRVVRRLRHLVRARLVELPPDVGVVVRALPSAAGATSTELAMDLDGALRSALRKLPAAGDLSADDLSAGDTSAGDTSAGDMREPRP